MKIGEQIRKLRKNENLSQEQLGKKVNVSRQAVYKWESDKGYPDIQNLIALSELFDISLDELIKGDKVFQKRIIVKGGVISNRRLLSSLNYFSIFFAPFLFPFITTCVGEKDIQEHGKRAFLSHCIPVILYFIMMGLFYLSSYFTGKNQPNSILIICSTIILIIISLSVVIWNVVQGLKVIKTPLKYEIK